ncbi:hypothetical protein F2Q68_00010478 [Brassica cretica]|uniref:Uncharacterized protein n=1 Tax=Brassica cretica TaxID=69181 RepID=A0A3N6QEA2_BRACR|nr:hypothetical protein F2Q68_00010478 [Brassica cretica]
MPRKFSFPSIKMFDGTGDPDDHIAQYRDVVVIPSPALIVDKPRDPASRIPPYGYGLVYVVDILVAAG